MVDGLMVPAAESLKMRELLYAVPITIVATIGIGASLGVAEESVDRQFGTVHFNTSCNETAQRRFDRAMRHQHSFWYKHLKRCSRKPSRPIRRAASHIGALHSGW
jgi:hypothetical protein